MLGFKSVWGKGKRASQGWVAAAYALWSTRSFLWISLCAGIQHSYLLTCYQPILNLPCHWMWCLCSWSLANYYESRNILQQSDSYDLKSVWLLHGWHVTAVKIKAAEERLPAAVFILVTAAKPTPFSDFEPSVYNTSDPWYLELCWKNL